MHWSHPFEEVVVFKSDSPEKPGFLFAVCKVSFRNEMPGQTNLKLDVTNYIS